MIFEISVIIISILALVFLMNKDKNYWKRFVIIFIGVLLFEYFTQALWHNVGLESWTYIYLDVNWVLTLVWTFIIICSMAFVDYKLSNKNEGKRFVWALVLITSLSVVAELLFLSTGIREYPEAIRSLLEMSPKVFGSLPLRMLIYIPSFMALVLAFTRYWENNFKIKLKRFGKK